MDDQFLREILSGSRTVAMVGLSAKPERDSYQVAAYLKEHGYRVIPVNPGVGEVLGERAYASLADIPEPVDIVDIFRRPEDAPAVVAQALVLKPRAVWLQLGVGSREAAQVAGRAGIPVVMDRCLKMEHIRLGL